MAETADTGFPVFGSLAGRVEGKLRRMAFDRRYLRDRRRYAQSIPKLGPMEQEVVGALDRDGAYLTNLEDLGVPDVPVFLSRARALFAEMAAVQDAGVGSKSYVVHGRPSMLANYHDLLLQGLDDTWLNIVEGYLGLPPAFRGMTARRDLADGQVVETRMWHLDDEDKRIVKFIVYVEDVDETGGGFEYVPKTSLPPGFERYRRVDDAEMLENVPRDKWVRCAGPAGTVIIGDTCSIWHHGTLPEKHERRTLFFGYNSTRPRHPQYCDSMIPRDQKEKLSASLSARQRAALMAPPDPR